MPNPGTTADNQIPGPPKPGNGSNDATSSPPLVDESQISGDMHTEEPTGWDQAPQAIKTPREKRHPRPDGVGGIEPAKGPDLASDHI